MRMLIYAIAGASALAIAPAAVQAAQPMESGSFKTLGEAFEFADVNDSGALSPNEYWRLRGHVAHHPWTRVTSATNSRQVRIDRASFGVLDLNDNDRVSRSEFVRRAGIGARLGDVDYVPLPIYVTANRVDSDELYREPVQNLRGDQIGRVEGLARHGDTGRHYILVSMLERTADATPTRYRTGMIGVPIDDIILNEDGGSLMLTSAGESELLERSEPQVNINELERVETIYDV